jgi:predicted N-formylglutamate amidohydrolase
MPTNAEAKEDAWARAFVEVVAEREAAAPLLLTCEHGSEVLPPEFRWCEDDAWLRGTHWAFDLGAAELTRELARTLGAGAVIAGFSRLVVDPNRPLDSDTLVRNVAEGRLIVMNTDVDAASLERRLALWRAYHDALDRLFLESVAPLALSVHSFTPVYEGSVREVEVGVLFDREEELATLLCARFRAAGFEARLNEPYSGKLGLIYSVSAHAAVSGRRALELELRQDLAVRPEVRARVIGVLASFAREVAERLRVEAGG